MVNFEQAQYLLGLRKLVGENDNYQESMNFMQPFPFQKKLNLFAPDDDNFSFLYEVNQSSKNQFKLSLYLMDEETKIGLLRVDFRGQHENPQTIIETLPAKFHPYVGKFFTYDEHHIHYFTEGYRTSLDWAIPLSEDDFNVKRISGNNDVVEAFYSFNRIINLQTEFKINPILL